MTIELDVDETTASQIMKALEVGAFNMPERPKVVYEVANAIKAALNEGRKFVAIRP